MPENAQQQVNSILFPNYWELSAQTLTWDESLPTSDEKLTPENLRSLLLQLQEVSLS